MNSSLLIEVEALVENGCHVHFHNNGDGWECIAGHHLTPRWPTVTSQAPTLNEAVRLLVDRALAAHNPNAEEEAYYYVTA